MDPTARSVLSRRALLAALLASACTRKRARRYQGWLFVASNSEKAIAVADLASFRRLTTIPLPCAPDQVLHSGDRVYATCADARTLVEIDAGNFRVAGKMALPGRPVAARLLPNKTALLLTQDSDALLLIDLAKHRITARLALPGPPGDLDFNGSLAAITIPGKDSILRVALAGTKPELRLVGSTDTGLPCLPVRFRRDGKTILAGATTVREVLTIDAATGALLARLPVPVSPSRFSFNPDGGQMFVTGAGADVVAIVSPYQNEVAETILAGRTPYAMAVSDQRNMLFVTNPGSGDLTILDIESRSPFASVHVGEMPGEILLTPDGEYALVLDQRSGNVSVVRLSTVLDRKNRTSSPPSPLFTVFPTAADARSAVIVPYPIA